MKLSGPGEFDTAMPLETPLLSLHAPAHAELGEYFGTRLPARFGDFDVEYSAARKTVALVDANFKALFSFSGPDRHRYLNAVLSSNVRDLAPGQGAVGLLLTPQGHILAEVETYALEDRILAVSDVLVRERTFATLEKFIIMDDVSIEDLTDSTGVLELIGPRAVRVISDAARKDLSGLTAFAHAGVSLGSHACRVIRRTSVSAGYPGVTLVAARTQLGALWRELERLVREQGGAPAGMEALNSLRLEFGSPWFGWDYDDKNIPHEAGLEHSHISYEKGCYTGQEIVERVRSRGHANRRLVEMQFAAPKPPAPGTALFTGADQARSEAGHVTSAAFSPSLGRPIGLGYLRREHANPGTRLDASGVPAEVIRPPLSGEQPAA